MTTEAEEQNGWEWSLVEIFGHRSHAGRCREEERFGSKMMRVDVPIKGDPVANGWETHWYGGASIFSYTLTDEKSVMRANKPYEPATPYRLRAPEAFDADDDIDQHDTDQPRTEADRIKEIADRAEERSRTTRSVA